MTIEGVVIRGQGANDDAAGLGHGHGSLGAELVFIVAFPLPEKNPWSASRGGFEFWHADCL